MKRELFVVCHINHKNTFTRAIITDKKKSAIEEWNKLNGHEIDRKLPKKDGWNVFKIKIETL